MTNLWQNARGTVFFRLPAYLIATGTRYTLVITYLLNKVQEDADAIPLSTLCRSDIQGLRSGATVHSDYATTTMSRVYSLPEQFVVKNILIIGQRSKSS